ncbi:MAG: type II toxin-antitoxin system MqsA family antitoxin [Candidatus Hydrogenedentes bacterium]|nr:type II toxin-antitoxin system MqsA family antitoxin [Candidatus Hydrogenedentota bacterium]
MTCLICKHGETGPGTTTVTLERDGCTVIIKDVPADICENCGEYYLDENVSRELLSRAERAIESNAEFQIIRYAA